MSIEATLTPVQPEPSGTRPNNKRWLVLAVVLAVLVSGTTAWWWRNHPDESFSGGYGMQTERQVGQPMWTVLVHWNELDMGGVTITALEPEFEVNTSEATVDYILCELRQPLNENGGYESFGYGMHANRMDQFCASTRPAVGADLRSVAEGHEELLVGVTPTRPGRTVIDSHRIAFEAGWQRGRDEIGVGIKIVTPEKR